MRLAVFRARNSMSQLQPPDPDPQNGGPDGQLPTGSGEYLGDSRRGREGGPARQLTAQKTLNRSGVAWLLNALSGRYDFGQPDQVAGRTERVARV